MTADANQYGDPSGANRTSIRDELQPQPAQRVSPDSKSSSPTLNNDTASNNLPGDNTSNNLTGDNQLASDTPPQPQGRFARLKATKTYIWFDKILSFLIAQWFFIFLGVFIALAHSYPEFAKSGGTVKAQYSISYGAVAVIFLVSGLSMSSKDLMKNTFHWRAHFTVLTSSFLITSAIIYGIVTGIAASHDDAIDKWLLVGLIVTHACPTTVSSNVVMTKQAHGNDILTLCEVFIGNVLGAFITPALVQMYLRGRWEFGNPTHQTTGDSSMTDLYAEVMKQVGLSVFVPLFVGQVVQNVLPKQTKWCLTTFKLNKVGSFMLLLIMFQSFSTAFAQNAFESVSHASIIFLVFFNIGIYLFFTVLTYAYSRPYWLKYIFHAPPSPSYSKWYNWGYSFFVPFYYNRRDTVAMMLCGPAKTAALGVSLVSSQYGSDSPKLGTLLVPLVLYQAEQVMTAQILVNFMRKWVHAEDNKVADEENFLEAHPDQAEVEAGREGVARGGSESGGTDIGGADIGGANGRHGSDHSKNDSSSTQ